MIFNCCILIHKIILNKKPRLLANDILKINEKHQYNTRSGTLISINHTKTHTAEKCITFKGYNWYNKLPENMKKENRLNVFRRLLKGYVKEKNVI